MPYVQPTFRYIEMLDSAKHLVESGQGKKRNVALLSHFCPSRRLSGNATAHDLVVTVFQEKPEKPLRKQLKNKMPLSHMTSLTKLSC